MAKRSKRTRRVGEKGKKTITASPHYQDALSDLTVALTATLVSALSSPGAQDALRRMLNDEETETAHTQASAEPLEFDALKLQEVTAASWRCAWYSFYLNVIKPLYGFKKLMPVTDQQGDVVQVDNGGGLSEDGDFTFLIKNIDPPRSYQGTTFGELHCEITPCNQDDLASFIETLKKSKLPRRVKLGGTLSFDPAHSGGADTLEIHPVEIAEFAGLGKLAWPDKKIDLSEGVIVVMSGGFVDPMNPKDIRDRMDRYIDAVNADPFVQQASGGKGLRYKLIPGQPEKHLHQTQWRAICDSLKLLTATPLIIAGHSNGGAAAMNLARCLQSQGKSVDLLWTADSVLTLDDNGDPYEVPSNVKFNINPYVIPTPEWILAPFPIGTKNHRPGGPIDGVLNIGLKYHLPGAWAHHNAFYDPAGGDFRNGVYTYPFILLDATLAVLRGASNAEIIPMVVDSLQTLSNRAGIEIHVSTAGFEKIIEPQ
jgi:hypothetical protein